MRLIFENNFLFKISDNNLFLICIGKKINDKLIKEDTSELYILEEYLPKVILQNPKIFDFFTLNKKSKRLSENSILYNYVKFSLNKLLKLDTKKNDCLLFAERISLNDPKLETNSSIFRVESDKTNRRFGVSDKINKEITNYTKNYYIKKNPRHNVEVNPEIGSAYAMVPNKIPEDGKTCPYHAASVIFKDENTNITLEADAGLKKRELPVFDMYSTKQDNFTFYASHFSTYLTKDDKINKKFKLPLTLHLKKDIANIEDKKEKKEKKINKNITSSLNVTTRSRKQPFKKEAGKKTKKNKKKQKKTKKVN